MQHSTQPQTPLARQLRERINRLAHQAAMKHESEFRALLMKRVQTARDAGATLDKLSQLIDTMKTAPP